MSIDRARASRIAVLSLVVLAITLISWHALPLEPQPGLDASWESALHMAANRGVGFGSNLIFTYGPLGFLSVPTLWYAGTGAIAVFYVVLVRVAVIVAVFAAARSMYGDIAGAIAALLVAAAAGQTRGLATLGEETVPFLILMVWIVWREHSPRRLLALLAAGGAVAGLEILNKLSVGIEMTVLVLIAAATARGRRDQQLAVTVASLVAALLVAWAATGQEFAALPAFVYNAGQIVSGYSSAMGLEHSPATWEYAAAAVAFVLGLWTALQMTSGPVARARRVGVLALWVAFCFFEFKEAFTRHEGSGHGAVYFVGLLGGLFALCWRRDSRVLVAICSSALFVFALAAQSGEVTSLFNPVANAETAVNQAADVTSSARSDAITDSGERTIQDAYPIDPGTLALLRGHTVHVMPYQTSVVWAYNLDWRPLPVFQSYSAYTRGLDRLDTRALTSRRAPQRILRNLDPEIDGRLEAFDEPAASRAILCRYRELRTTSSWQVLGLAHDRCGTPVSLGTIHAGWNERVAVPPPPPHSFVFARVQGVGLNVFEQTISLLLRPASRFVLLDAHRYRLVENTAADGLILRAAPGVDFRAPFNIAPNSTTIAVRKGGTGAGGGRPISFSFYAEPVTTGPRGRYTAVSPRPA